MADDDRALIEAIALSPIAMVVSNPRRVDNPIEFANRAFCDLTGYSEAEVVGRNCRFLAGENTEEERTDEIRRAILDQRPVLVDILNYRRDGNAFRNGVMITPLFDSLGQLAWFLGSQVDLGPAPGPSLDRRRTIAADKVALLPPRQFQVLRLMAQGKINKQIAWELKITEKTVKMHRARLLDRLGIGSSAEAIRIAVEAGL